MRLKRSNTAHAPVAATVTTFSIYFTGLCIILSLSSAGSCGKLSWSSQGQSSGDKAPLCQDLIGAAEAAPLRSYLLEAVCPLFPGLNLGAAVTGTRPGLHVVVTILWRWGRAGINKATKGRKWGFSGGMAH